MGADKGKKQKLGENGGDEESAEILQSVDKLQEYQEELEKINEEVSDKVLEIEQKYNALRKPVYDKRNEVIKTIPDFWLTAFLNHPALGDLLTEEDQKIFRYLSSLEVEDSKDVKSGNSISFIFKPNPFLEDTKLTKTYNFLEEGTAKITATDIKWKEGMGIPNGVADEKKGSKRPPADESFFTWFSETEQKDVMDEFQDEIAEIIKDDLWPNPLIHFCNDGGKGGSDEEEGAEQEDGSDDGEDDDEEEE